VSTVLVADRSGGGRLFAVVDQQAHHVAGSVAERKFCAFLTPFRNFEEANAALSAAGATLVGERVSTR
jgi:uncharacterized protein (DUF1810 family)